MKFNFKIQQYQTDAVESTVAVFAGQPTQGGFLYRRDLGKNDAGASLMKMTMPASETPT